MFELFLLGPAVQFLESLDADQRRDVGRLLDLIRIDPYNDGRFKHVFPVPPAIASLYSNGNYWIVYHLVNNTKVNVWNIGFAHEKETPWRAVQND